MNLAAPFPVTVAGTEIILRPLTVRQRLAYGNTLSERARQRALEAGKAAGVSGKELAELIAEASEASERVSFVVVSCFTFEGALLVLAMASGEREAELIGSNMEPGELGVLASRCLGVDVSMREKSAGN